MGYNLIPEENAATKRAIYIGKLLAGNLPATMLTDLRSFLNNLRTKWAFPGKEPLVDLCDRFIDIFLENFVSEFYISDGLNGLEFTDISNHFSSF